MKKYYVNILNTGTIDDANKIWQVNGEFQEIATGLFAGETATSFGTHRNERNDSVGIVSIPEVFHHTLPFVHAIYIIKDNIKAFNYIRRNLYNIQEYRGGVQRLINKDTIDTILSDKLTRIIKSRDYSPDNIKLLYDSINNVFTSSYNEFGTSQLKMHQL